MALRRMISWRLRYLFVGTVRLIRASNTKMIIKSIILNDFESGNFVWFSYNKQPVRFYNFFNIILIYFLGYGGLFGRFFGLVGKWLDDCLIRKYKDCCWIFEGLILTNGLQWFDVLKLFICLFLHPFIWWINF